MSPWGYLNVGRYEHDKEPESSQGNSSYSRFSTILRSFWLLFGTMLISNSSCGLERDDLALLFRQKYLKAGIATTRTRVAVDANRAIVAVDDSAAHPKTYAAALLSLRAEERLKDALADVFGNSRSGIEQRDNYAIASHSTRPSGTPDVYPEAAT